MWSGIAEKIQWRLTLVYSIVTALLKRRLVLGSTRFIGVTGSAGKTTTKDLAAGILAAFGPCASSTHSMNDPASVAGTVLKTRRSDRFCVAELSASRPQQLIWPLRILTPSVAVITLIEREHANKNYGVNEILQEKSRLVHALPRSGVAILNIDDPLLQGLGEQCHCRVIWVGRGEGATLRLLEASSRWPEPLSLVLEYGGQRYSCQTRLHGVHLSLPVLCALAIALASGIHLDAAIAALAAVPPVEGRMQVVEGSDGVVFVRDDWKAPLWSLQAPLDFMQSACARRKVIVMGTLSDYARSPSKIYPRVAASCLSIADLVIFVGHNALRATKKVSDADRPRLQAFVTLKDAADFLRAELRPGDLVLLKGSSRVDHLVRVMLDRSTPVRCWKSACGITRFCTGCPHLYAVAPGAAVSPADDNGRSSPSLQLPGAALTGWPCIDRVLVGLGNSGEQFKHTRHNVGHLLLDDLARQAALDWRPGFGGEYVLQDAGLSTTLLFKAPGPINHCGPVIKALLETLRSDIAHCIIIHDDIDLVLGEAKLKQAGGDNGHRGVRSVLREFGHGSVRRIRLGVRGRNDGRLASDLVHSHFTDAEWADLREGFARATLLLERALPGAGPARERPELLVGE
jgi:aminoacyl-tRNA hydrolase